MKKNLLIILAVIIIPLAAYFALNITGHSEIGSADAKAAHPQIIKFTSTMCLDCQTMNKLMKEIYPKYQDDIILTEINVQDGNPKNDEWIKKYDVSLVPTIILINSNGSQVKRIEGAIDKDKLEKCLQELK